VFFGARQQQTCAITLRFAPNEGNEIQVLRRLLIFESAGVFSAAALALVL